VFDAQFSPDGTTIAAVDSHGCLLVYSVAQMQPDYAHAIPDEQFFHTDYR
jgi:hypothetical protein